MNPLAGIHNYTKPDWRPLERAARLIAADNVESPSVAEVCDSSLDEIRAELRKAFGWERTWGAVLEKEYNLGGRR